MTVPHRGLRGRFTMKTSRILSAISFGLMIAAPACSGKFTSIGTDAGDASTQGGSNNGTGGSLGVGGNGNNGTGGSTGVTCLYNGVNYQVGTIPNQCGCICTQGGTVACDNISCVNPGTGGSTGVAGTGGSTGVTCLYNGVNYAAGTSFKSTDGCNSCSCDSNGQVACTMMACAPGTGGSTGVGGSTGTSSCVTAADCHGALPQPCLQCTDGSSGCAHFVCNSGSCEIAYCGSSGTGGSSGTAVRQVLPAFTTVLTTRSEAASNRRMVATPAAVAQVGPLPAR